MSIIEKMAQDDFIWDAIIENCPPRKKKSSAFDFNIDCPMCVILGEARPDRTQRCGLVKNPDGFAISCFNCPLRIKWTYGSMMSRRLKDFLSQIGIGELAIKRMSHKALSISRMVQQSPEALTILGTSFLPEFDSKPLPFGARPIMDWLAEGCSDPMFYRAIQYLYDRGEEIAENYEYFWTPESGPKNNMNERIIMPLTHKSKTVGYTARMTTNVDQGKYWTKQPEDFLFNNGVLNKHHRKYVFIVEGPFDAIAIDGVGTMGARLSAKQIAWIKHSNLTPILVADLDKKGAAQISHALDNDWGVAFPRLARSGWWDRNIKDAADAVQKYGRLYTIKSIIESTTFNKRQIEVNRRLLV